MQRRLVLPGFVLSIVLSVASSAFPQRRELRGYDPAKPPLANSEAEKTILDTLDGILKAHQTYLNVPMLDGRALRLLAEAVGAKNIIEIGTSTGYSGLWFCLALQRTGGHLTTFEIDRKGRGWRAGTSKKRTWTNW